MSSTSSWSRRGLRQPRLKKKTTTSRKSRAEHGTRLFLESLEERVLLSVAQWSFNEGTGTTAYDSVGSNLGTLVNGPAWTTGLIDGALSFDGVDDYVEIADSPSLDFMEALTMEVWVQLDSINNEYASILWKADDTAPYLRDYVLMRNRTDGSDPSWMGKFQAEIQTSNGLSGITSQTAPIIGEWYQVTSTYDGNTHKLYVNGRLETSRSWSGAILVSDDPLFLSKSGRPNDPRPLDGTVDGVALYNRALTAEEIWQRYHEHVNAAPVAQSLAVMTEHETAKNITLAATDAENDPLTYSIVSNPSHGTLTQTSGTIYVYTPEPGWYGPDAFTYRANDGRVDSSLATVSITVTADGLVSQWEFNEGSGGTASDSARNNPGALVNGPAWTTGLIDGALSFDGSDDIVSVPDSASLDFADAITMEAWVKFDSVDNRYETIFSKVNTQTAPALMASYQLGRNRTGDYSGNFGRLRSSITTTSGLNYASSTTVPVSGQWYQVVGTYDGVLHRMYINGRLEGESVWSGTILPSNDPLWIGRLAYPGVPEPLDGSVDGLTLYDRALTAEEIWQRYHEHVNAAPVAQSLAVMTEYETAKNITLAATDAENDPLTYSIVSNPSHGTLTQTSDTIYVYTPKPGWYGPDALTYKVYDGRVDSNVATVSITVTVDGLVSQWEFNEGSGGTASDSARNNPGALVNGPTWTTGIIDGALNFDGGDDYISVPDAPSLDITDAITMEAWVRFDSVDNRYETIFGKINTQTADYLKSSYQLGRSRTDGSQPSWMGKMVSRVTTTAGFSPIVSETVPVSGHWYQVVGTYDGVDHRLYINGRLEASVPWSGSILPSSEPLWIARSGYPGYPEPLYGAVDEVALYNRALTAEEIWQRYHEHVNAAPVAQGQAVLTERETAKSITFAATDAENDPLTYAIVSTPNHGTLTQTSDTVYIYTPEPDWYGPDAFTYKVHDGRVDSNVATVSITVTVDGLVSQWEFNEGSGGTASDSARNNPGALVNGPTWTTGVIDGALSFDGSDDYVSVPDSPSLDIVDAITMEAWVRLDSVDNRYETIFSKVNTQTASVLGASYALGRNRTDGSDPTWMGIFRSSITTTDGYIGVGSTTIPVSGQWYHVVGTYDGAWHKIYVNGRLEGDFPWSGTILSSSEPLWIGRLGYPGYPEPLDGTVDEVTLYNRALTAEEIRQRYLDHVSTTPLVNAGPDVTVLEGESFARTGSFVDPDPNLWLATVDYGDGTGTQPLVLNVDKSFALSHIYANDSVYSVSVTIADDKGEVGSDSFSVTVNNAAPAVTQFSVTPANFASATEVTAAGQFVDPGMLDIHNATIDWGDGSATEPLVLKPDKSFDVGHSYGRFGVFTVVVSITDDDGGADSASFAVNAKVKRQGTEFRINNSTGNAQTYPAVAMNAAGDSVVVWESRHEGQISIFGQIYDSQGNPRTGQFRISDYSVDERVRPAVGMDDAGNFVVAWQGWGSDAYGWGINAQRFSTNGAPMGGRFVANSYQAGYQSSAAVAMSPSGEFVIAWQDEMNGGAMFAQRYDASGTRQGGQFQVNSRPGSITSYGRVAMDAAGNFVATWRENAPGDGSSYAVFARRFAADGTQLGDDFRVNLTNTGYDGSLPQVAVNAQGESVITWVGRTTDGGFNVYAQCFTTTGARLGSEIIAASVVSPNQLVNPTVAVDQNGTFVVLWGQSGAADGDGWGVYGRRFNQCGLPQGEEFLGNTTTAGDQFPYYLNGIGARPNGDFMAVWGGNGVGDDNGIFGQRFAVVNTIPTVEIGSNASVDEGDSWSRVASFSDPDADTWTATVDYGNGSGIQPLVLNVDKTFLLNHTYSDNGSYIASVRLLDDWGALAEASLVVTVTNVAPSPSIVSIAATRVEGTSIAVSGTATDPAGANDTLSYAWSVYKDGGTTAFASGTGANWSFTPTDNGSYEIRLTASDEDGGSATASQTISVANVNPSPSIVSIGATRVEGTSIAVSGTATDPAGANDTLSYAWSVYKDGGPTAFASGTGANWSFTPTDNGSYEIRLTASDEDGGSATASQTISVANVAPSPSIVSIGATRVEGTSIAVSGTAMDPAGANDTLSYAWSVYKDGGPTAFASGTGANWSFTPTDNGSYEIRLTASDEDGGSATASQTISVANVNPSPSIVSIGATRVEGTSIAVSGTAMDPAGANDTLSYAWSVYKDGGTTAFASGTGANWSFTPTDNGSYEIRLTASDEDGGSATASQTISVANVNPSPSIVSIGSTRVEGTSIAVAGTATDPAGANDTLSYAWSVYKDGGTTAFASGAGANWSFTPTDNGSYEIRLTASDEDGGSATASQTISVANADPSPSIVSIGPTRVEGTTIAVAGTATDPAGANDTLSYAWSVYKDGGTTAFASGAGASWSFTPTDNGSYEIRLTASDEDGGSATVSQTISVANADPSPSIVSIGPTRVEGTTIAVAGTATDPAGANDTLSYAWSVLKEGVFFVSGNGANWSFTPTDNGGYDIRLTARDEDGGSATVSQTISVADVPPTLSLSGLASVNEGAMYTLNLTSSDPGTDTISAWEITWGDGNVQTVIGNPASVTHGYADGLNNYTVSAKATDEDGTYNAGNTVAVRVDNVAPTLSLSGPASINEGAVYTLNITSNDPGADTISAWEITWGDGNVQTVIGNPASVTHTYADGPNNHTVSAKATDEDGTYNAGNTVAVRVDNVAPTLSLSGLASVNEGAAYTLNITSSDPGADTISAWEITWGDGNVQTVIGNPASVTHTYADGPNNHTVSAKATDEDGMYNAGNAVAVRVDDVPPTLSLSGLASVNEGAAYTLNITSSDPGADTISAWEITWGDGNVQTVIGNPASVTHTYADGLNNYTVSAKATDDDGTYNAGSTLAVRVDNVAPTLSLGGAAAVDEGSLYTLNLTSSDPGTDTISSWKITWGDGNVQTVSGNPASVTHTYADGLNNYTVSAKATDEDGTYNAANTVAVRVDNVPPTLSLGGAAAVDEGSLYTLNLTSSDPGTDTISSWEITWGDGNVQTVSGNPASVTHTYADDAAGYTISAKATDDDGTYNAGSTLAVRVDNVAPQLTPVDDQFLNSGDSLPSVTFTDPGADTWSATLDYGDGTVIQVDNITQRTVALSGHNYASPGVYQFSMTLEDDEYLADTMSFLVAYETPALYADANATEVRVHVVATDLVIDGLTASYTEPLANVHGVLIYGNLRSESFTVDVPGLTTPGVIPTGIWFVAGESQDSTDNDDLVLTNSEGAPLTNFDYTTGGPEAGTITVDSLTVHFFEFEPIYDNLVVENRTFRVGTAGDTSIEVVDSGSGDSRFSTIQDSTTRAFESIQFANPDATRLQIAGGGGNTTIDVSASTDVIEIQGGTGHTTVVTRVGNPVFFNEGDTFALDLSDLAGSPDGLLVDWGDGSPTQTPTSSIATHTYVQESPSNQPYLVAVLDGNGSLLATTQVTVGNVAPRVMPLLNQTFYEGSAFSATAAFTDPGADTWTASVDYGDGSGVQPLTLNPDKTFTLNHAYADNGIFTVTVRVQDDDLGTGQGSLAVTVNNVPPTLSLSGLSSVNEGAPYILNLSSSDPGADTIGSWMITWGDGNVQTVNGNPASVMHTYADGLTNYTISATSTDEDGTYDVSNTVAVTVQNVPSTLSLSGLPSVNEGAPYTLNLSSSDPGADSISFWEITWGDGNVETVTGNPASVTHIYAAGPNTYTISATATDEDGMYAAGNTVTVAVRDMYQTVRSLSGTVFDDVNNDRVQDTTESGIDGITVQLQDQVTGATWDAVTSNGGRFTFENLPVGTYRLLETQPDGYLDGDDTVGTRGGVANSQPGNWDEIVDIVLAADGEDGTGYLFGELRPSGIRGLVWEDVDGDGTVDFGEQAIEGVVIQLHGTDDRYQAVDRVMSTDAQGIYEFTGLRPGSYRVMELEPARRSDGQESLGSVVTPPEHAVNAPTVPANDVFRVDFFLSEASGNLRWVAGCDAVNFNFAEGQLAGDTVHAGQTATIGFWQNKHGQSLIKSLNGGASSTQLGNWLAATFPNMYGGASETNLAGKTNSQIAKLYQDLFKRNGRTSPGGPPKLDAQVLALALAVYVTDSDLAGQAAVPYGFQVDSVGVGVSTYDVGSANRDAFGLQATDSTIMTVMSILLATDAQTHDGLLYDRNGDGRIDAFETTLRTKANSVYAAINELGQI